MESHRRPAQPEIYSYRFIVDGTDVLDRTHTSFKRWRSCDSLLHVPGDPPKPWDLQDVPHGTVHLHTYKSESLGGTLRRYRVYTPHPLHFANQNESLPLPVTFLLHGYGDDEAAWFEVGKVHHIADHLIAAGKMKPMVIVMPFGHALLEGEDAELFSRERWGNNFDAVSTDLIKDLLPLVEASYFCGGSPEKRAVVGLSMGGGQALGIGLKHSDTFAYVGGFSSGIMAEGPERIFPEITENPKLANDRLKLLWFACGKDDRLLERNEKFAQWLTEKEITHQFKTTDGAHAWKVWRHYLTDFLPFLFR